MSFQIIKKAKLSAGDLQCLFCGDCENVVEEPQAISFETIKNATIRRNDEIKEKFDNLYNSNLVKQPFSWHRACYASYISEEKIRRREILLRKQEEDAALLDAEVEESQADSSGVLRQSLRKHLPFDISVCIFCNNLSKKKETELLTVTQLGTAQKIFDISRRNNDHVFTRTATCVSATNIQALKLKYHRTCYLEYNRNDSRKSDNLPGRPPTTMEILQPAFDQVTNEIEKQSACSCFELSYITNKIVELIKDDNIYVDNKQIKELLVKKYNDNVMFTKPINKTKSALVFLSALPIEELPEHIRLLSSIDYMAKKIGKVLKDEAESIKMIEDGYLIDENIIEKGIDNIDIPHTWNLIFQYTAHEKLAKFGVYKEIKMHSIFSDFFTFITGRKTAKHVALAECIHHLTRSRHIITMLNRLGHCVSYSVMEGIDDGMYQSLLSNDEVILPSNIIKDSSLYAHGSIDNNDFQEETLSGQGTTHVTATVIYQQTDPTKVTYVLRSKNVQDTSFTDAKIHKYQEIQHFNPTIKNPVADSYIPIKLNNEKSLIDFKTMFWVLCRAQYDKIIQNFCRPTKNFIPGWTPFNQLLCTKNLPLTTVGFCPLIPNPPTSQDVVYSSMKNFVAMCDSLGQEYQILTCDMAIYQIAKDIQLCSTEFPNLILRIGTFHLQKNFLRCLGQYIQGSGLDQIITQSGVYGPTTFQSILEGKQYNRAVRAHKMIYEVYRFLQLIEFVKEKGKIVNSEVLLPLLQDIREAIVDKDTKKLIVLLRSKQSIIQDFFNQFENYIKKECEESETFKFHSTYCTMVEILLDSIKADRTNDYDLHVQSTRRMLPYFFAMNHHNYTRGVSCYLQDMAKLPTKVIADLRKGALAVKRSVGTFNSVGCDLALEQTQNRSSAIAGGLIGITNIENAMQAWLLLYHFKSAIHMKFTSYLKMDPDTTNDIDTKCHAEWSQPRIDRDESDIAKLLNLLSTSNPFESHPERNELCNISTGAIADKKISDCLLNLQKNGESLIDLFEKERFIEKKCGIFHKVKHAPFFNFEYKEKSSSSKLKLPSDDAELALVNKLFLIAGQRNYDLKKLTARELIGYPKYLFNREGYYHKSQKSVLLNEIVESCNCKTNINLFNLLSSENSVVYLIDAMSLVHLINLKNFSTFGDFAAAFYNNINGIFSYSSVIQVHVVFDRYDEISIKFLESQMRSQASTCAKVKILGPDTKISKDIKNFFALTENKLQLVKFLCTNFSSYVRVPKDKEFFISGGFTDPTQCFKFCDTKSTQVPELKSNHLEADTRLFAHTFHAMKKISNLNIVIQATDTDIFILGIHFWYSLKALSCKALWFNMVSKQSRILGCHTAAESLGIQICKILPSLHAITGCDTTSRLGSKKKALQFASSPLVQEAFMDIGESSKIECINLQKIEAACTYIAHKKTTTANNLRHGMMIQIVGFKNNLSNAFCTSDALYLHILRAWAQTYIWKNAWKPMYACLNLENFGYKTLNNDLYPIQTSEESIPSDLVQPCKCNARCSTLSCSCKKAGVYCIELCKCDSESSCINR